VGAVAKDHFAGAIIVTAGFAWIHHRQIVGGVILCFLAHPHDIFCGVY